MNKFTLFSSAMVIPCLLVTGAGFAAEQNNQQYHDMHKQLSIMSDIIKSSVSDQTTGQRSKINSIQSTYLRGQGIVFTINSAANNRQWGSYNFNFTMPEMPVAPIAPSVNDNFEENFNVDINETVTHALETAANGYERAMEIFEHGRERNRELREEQRNLAYRLKDVEREKRDLTYQLARANDERKEELNVELSKLSEQAEKLQASKRKIAQKSSKVVAEQKAQQAEQAKERVSYYQKLTANLTETLCLYGNGLKALPKDEHVSIIFKSAGDKSAGRYKDSILVFSKKDIARCSADSIDSAALIKKAEVYQF
ncbi:hypothetical protein [Cognaticolwellia mytili]|uniref:hypothetical protein n=1 Tax=Cognaticolwellia mytili TaxID=1888913 RepID=UPI000A16E0BE|nr:hypothetical protein [Cognaticolwellia mytili]